MGLYLHLFDYLPSWLFFLVSATLAGISMEIGYIVGRRRRKLSSSDGESSVGIIVASILALLAFLLAFTFNLVATRYEDRRQAAIVEGNAIGTTFLRSKFLPEDEKVKIKSLLQRYISTRLQATTSEASNELILQTIKENEKIQKEIWDISLKEGQKNPSIINGLFIQTVNDMIDIFSKRLILGLQNSLPLPLWFGLFSVMIVGLFSVGYQTGLTGKIRSIVAFGLIVVFSFILTLIADLDHPRKGWFRTTQTPLVGVEKMMEDY